MTIQPRNVQPTLLPPKPKVELKRPDETHAIEAGRLMKAVDQVSRGNYVLLMATMEEKYPGIGWQEQANDLENFYMKYGLELSGRKPATIFK